MQGCKIVLYLYDYELLDMSLEEKTLPYEAIYYYRLIGYNTVDSQLYNYLFIIYLTV